MKTYYTGGTPGDTYVTLCKLYSVAKREKILCRHYTRYKEAEQTVREIFSLLPNINVEFLENKPLEMRICGAFQHRDEKIEQDLYGLEPEYYPEFELESVERFNLPQNYAVIQSVSGIKSSRKLGAEKIDEISKNSRHPLVFVGKKGIKTSVREIVSVIRGSRHFYGPQGFLSFVAVSQKVPSTIYITSGADDVAVQGRIEAVKEWRKFLVGKERA